MARATLTQLLFRQAAAEEVKKVTGGTLNTLINNAALTHDDRVPWRLEE